MNIKWRALSALTITLMACTEPISVPHPDGADLLASSPDPHHDGEGGATIFWSGVARELFRENLVSPPLVLRGYAVLGVAQYAAVVSAGRGPDRTRKPGLRAAVSGASVVALSYLFPEDAARLEEILDRYLDSKPRRIQRQHHASPDEDFGRAIGTRVVEYAKTDRFLDPWTGTVPVGPGLWFSTADPPALPAGASFGDARPYLLLSTDQFRPAPPPEFESPAFKAGLAEVREISDSRTARQDSIAKFWSFEPGTNPGPTYWYEVAMELAQRYRLRERDAAHLLALVGVTAFDALLTSHEAKFTYWSIRPTQADPGIQLAIGLPNFPSYPSNHAVISSATARILGARFPIERERLDARAEEAALSRVFGGIHYRFDGEAGIRLGRTLAAWALKRDAEIHEGLGDWMAAAGVLE